MSDPKEFFTSIYTGGLWRYENQESRSGAGSTLEAAGPIIREIPILLRLLGAQTMLDIPCGDFTWMQETNLGPVEYIGADIVEQLVDDNNRMYGRPGRSFRVLDLITGPLPRVDIILCRDCFIHLTVPMIFSALENIVGSQSTYLLTSHYPWRSISNNEEVDGLYIGGRRINLEMAPFDFPAPLHSIPEAEKLDIAADKSLCVWEIAALRDPLRMAQARYRAA